MDYYLMHKDEKVAILNIDNNFGVINKVNTIEKELLPLCAQERILNDIQPIKLWWQNRAVSKNQSKINLLGVEPRGISPKPRTLLSENSIVTVCNPSLFLGSLHTL